MTEEQTTCPFCGSTNTAHILWGKPTFDEDYHEAKKTGRVVWGGCCVSEDDPERVCKACGQGYGESAISRMLRQSETSPND